MPYVLGAVVIGAVAFPVYSAMFRDRRDRDIPSAVAQFTRVVLVAVGGVYLIAALMADSIVLLGERWAPAASTLVILCGFGLGLSLLTTWYEIITSSGRLKQFLFFEIAHLILVVALLVTVTQYGINASALAQLVAVWFILPFVWWAMVRAKVAPSQRDLAGAVLGFGVPALACIAVDVLIRWSGVVSGPASFVGAALQLALLVVCYAAVALMANKQQFARVSQSSKGRCHMRVLHVAQPVDGGVAGVAIALAVDQHQRGWDVSVACPSLGLLPDLVRKNDVPLHEWSATRSPGLATLGEVRSLVRTLRAVQPDVVHLHGSKAGLAGRLAVRGRIPTIFQPHLWSFQADPGLTVLPGPFVGAVRREVDAPIRLRERRRTPRWHSGGHRRPVSSDPQRG